LLAAALRGDEPEDRRRRRAKVPAGPNRRIKHPKGLAWAALKALAHRLRPEGSFPSNVHLLDPFVLVITRMPFLLHDRARLSPSPRLAVFTRRVVACVDRILQKFLRLIGPKLRDIGKDMDHDVLKFSTNPLHFPDIDVLDGIAIIDEANGAL